MNNNKTIKLHKEIKDIQEYFKSWKVIFEDNSTEYFLKNNGLKDDFFIKLKEDLKK